MHCLNRCRRLAPAALVLVCVFAGSKASAQTQPVEDGARIRLQLNWGDDYQGTLLRWSTDSVYVHPENWSEPARLPLSGVTSIERSIGSGLLGTTLRHGAYGTLAGLALGVLVGVYDEHTDDSAGRSAPGIILTSSGVGLLLGLINGFTAEHWQPVYPVQ